MNITIRDLINKYKDEVKHIEFYCGNPEKKRDLFVPADDNPLQNDRILDFFVTPIEWTLTSKGEYTVQEGYEEVYPKGEPGDSVLLIVLSLKAYDTACSGRQGVAEYRYIDTIWRRKKPAGYCKYYLHPGHMTPKNIKDHGCLGKNCPMLEKNEDHEYWEQREKKKAQKKNRQNRLAELIKNASKGEEQNNF